MTRCICGHGIALHGPQDSDDAGCRWPQCGCSYFETVEQAERPHISIGPGLTDNDKARLRAAGVLG